MGARGSRSWAGAAVDKSDLTSAGGLVNGTAAGGQLSGSYPNPSVAGVTETGGPTALSLGAVADGQFIQRVGAALIGANAPTPTFGQNFKYAESLARTTTTTSDYSEVKLSLASDAFTGDLLIFWTAVMDNDEVSGSVRLQNTTDATTIEEQVFKSTSPAERRSVGGFARIAMSGGAKTFQIQFKDNAGGNTQGLGSARIAMWRTV